MIRHAREGDCRNLAALSIQVWLHTYARDGVRADISKYVLSTFTESHFDGLLQNPDYRILVYTEGEHLLGYIAVNLTSHYRDESNGYEVETLYVQEHFHGKGIGKKLLAEIRSQFGGRYWLSTWVHNDPAIGFYKKQGFRDIGEVFFQLGGEQHENRVLAYFDSQY